ncbi:hypothetical protein OC846_004321 [Tilletia horrida]|uniref:Uncharacterized protein n=1 Tax=Tilletia horrida TaxID=155126 RepID=A0AAN6JQH9_9BASI|nr:hypothetical protein OC846_004321 [Tilletia horrida]KAK0564044.1 hypothetical protein OC861_004504 [Tilletia horrida]
MSSDFSSTESRSNSNSNSKETGIQVVLPEPQSPLRILTGTALAGLAGAAYGSSYGILKHQTPARFAFQTSLNCLTFAFPFFALREYVISPAFQSLTPKTQYHHTSHNLRTHNLAPSAVTGALVGGGLSVWARGSKHLLSGMSTFGLLCLSCQYIGNELRIARVKLVSHYSSQLNGTAPPPAPTPPPSSSSPSTTDAQSDSPPSSSIWSKLSALSPVRKVSDEEYAQRLASQRTQAQDRISTLQRQAAELEAELGTAAASDQSTKVA